MGKSHYDPARHHRRSIRLKGHDYAGGGLYFVTICAHRKAGDIFGPPEVKAMVERVYSVMSRNTATAAPFTSTPPHQSRE